MVKVSKIISSTIKSGRRILKILGLGKEDIQTSYESMPFGIDSVPIKDLIAIQMETSERGKTVIVGYINKNQIADIGEARFYSLDATGAEQATVYLKKDGVLELNGNVDNAVKFIPLDAGLQYQTTAINAELVKIAAGLNAIVPGSYAHTPVTVNITSSKVETVKVP